MRNRGILIAAGMAFTGVIIAGAAPVGSPETQGRGKLTAAAEWSYNIMDKLTPSLSGGITIVGFGDSITQAIARMPDAGKRWLNLLERKLAKSFPKLSFKVVNSGVGGNSAREAMQRFDRDVLAHDPDFVLLEFGGNNGDLKQPERRVSLEEFAGHLADFRRRLPAKTRIIVITFPPLIDDQIAARNPPEVIALGGDAAINRYRNMTRAFAAEHSLPLVDFDRELKKRMPSASKNHYILDDGVHLTEAGNAVLAELVFDVLCPIITGPNASKVIIE